ncbi:hypothetical protein M513_07461 [Trichuris suis]|uniref:Endoplasmic reticulum junction formation protein lunapark n=1 Tax=Trichuris suis TaxID=68888 RepID=A0A085M2Y6_9BILA|nr:hypothetical protein M513_07461 [Trichuris suis]
MGLLQSKQLKKSYSAVLEKLEDEIEELDRSDALRRKREWQFDICFFIFVILSYFLLTYIGFGGKQHERRYEPFWLFILLFGYPFLLYLLRRIFSLYFARRRHHCHAQLVTLKQQRLQVLNEVKENETYKVAKELLDRFDATDSRPRARNAPDGETFLDQTPVQTPRRNVPPSAKIASEDTRKKAYGEIPATPITPRPILPFQRSWWERLMDVVLRDGPSYRYALICMYCKGHNGMAMIEEFEDLSFRCCYCNMLNPSKRQIKDKRQSKNSLEAKDKSGESLAAATTKFSRFKDGKEPLRFAARRASESED